MISLKCESDRTGPKGQRQTGCGFERTKGGGSIHALEIKRQRLGENWGSNFSQSLAEVAGSKGLTGKQVRKNYLGEGENDALKKTSVR